jgi:23S rRNA pseudouridine1911/1915/1917 synthase
MAQTLLDWLVREYPTAKRQTLRRMVQAGRVLVDAVPARNVRQVVEDDTKVRVIDAGKGKASGASKPSIDIVHEDADLLVVNKPAGLLTSTVPREPRPTLLAKVERYLAATDSRARVGLIHRLDRDAAGLLIFSKNDRAYRSLKSQFFDHGVVRQYAALVHGCPEPARDRISSRLVERADGIVYSTKQHGRGELAITEYEIEETFGDRSLLLVTLQTGKKHQIRVHLSERGHPIVGDRVYGRPNEKVARLFLLARRLSIIHPRTGKAMSFQLEIPAAFRMGAPIESNRRLTNPNDETRIPESNQNDE